MFKRLIPQLKEQLAFFFCFWSNNEKKKLKIKNAKIFLYGWPEMLEFFGDVL